MYRVDNVAVLRHLRLLCQRVGTLKYRPFGIGRNATRHNQAYPCTRALCIERCQALKAIRRFF